MTFISNVAYFFHAIISGLHHTSGVVLRKDVIADADADAIRLLREKGAIIIGLTNVPELCMWYVHYISFKLGISFSSLLKKIKC